MTMTPQFVDMTLSPIFDVIFFLLSSLVTGPSFMSISSLALELWQFSFVRDWPEIDQKLPNIWRLWRVRDTKIDTNVSSKMLLNAAKCQGYSIYCFWVITGKPRLPLKITPPPPTTTTTQIRIKIIFCVMVVPS